MRTYFAFIWVLLFFASAVPVLAASHTYSCADLTVAGSGSPGGSPAPTCSGGAWTFTGGSGVVSDWSSPAFDTSSGGPWVLHYTYSGSGTGKVGVNGPSALCAEVNVGSGGSTLSFDASCSPGSPSGIQLRANSSLNATLSNICIDNDGSCSGGGGGGGASSTVATTTIVDNPTQDVMNGVIVFFAAMFTVLWSLRRLKA